MSFFAEYAQNPLVVLFGVAAIGYVVGKVRVLGFSLGVAAVLFAGLGVGWLSPHAQIPEFVSQLGLVLFVYTLGLSSGPGFFAALRFKGLRDNALAVGVLTACFAITWSLAGVLGLGAARAAGLFAGALTNTPALASVIDTMKLNGASADALAVPVLAYSLTYPVGVLAPLLWVSLANRLFRVEYEDEPVPSAYSTGSGERIVNATVAVQKRPTQNASELRKSDQWSVNFGRVQRNGVTDVVHDETQFEPGDLVTIVGNESDVSAAADALGTVTTTHIDFDRSTVDYRRMFVSNALLTCRPLRELDLIDKYDAVITRVRRGDVDLVPDSDFELQVGDRARVLAPRGRFTEIEQLFGDSQRRIAEVDVITFSIGITIGLLLGKLPIPVGHGRSLELGLAGGPLIVGLVLGRLGRSGPLVWTSSFAANITLRQFGLVLFLSGVGLRAGHSLAGTQVAANVLAVVLGGALVTTMAGALALVVGHRFLKIPLGVMTGTLSGIHTQPAVLAYAVEKVGKDLPNVGYTSVYPAATIAKIFLAQALVYFTR